MYYFHESTKVIYFDNTVPNMQKNHTVISELVELQE